MSSTQAPIPKDDPLMIEWEKFKACGEYANAVNWGTYPSASIEMSEDGKGEVGITLNFDHIDGSVWAAFCAGWNARIQRSAEDSDRLAKKVLAYLGDSPEHAMMTFAEDGSTFTDLVKWAQKVSGNASGS